MHIRYDDILRRIPQSPKWWLDGVPRYDDFQPSDLCVYASEALLVHIRCQMCKHDFHIGLYDPSPYHSRTFKSVLMESRTLGMGDPPSGCPDPECTGRCSSAEEVAVLQFWERKGTEDWRRVPGFQSAGSGLERTRPTKDTGRPGGVSACIRRGRRASCLPGRPGRHLPSSRFGFLTRSMHAGDRAAPSICPPSTRVGGWFFLRSPVESRRTNSLRSRTHPSLSSTFSSHDPRHRANPGPSRSPRKSGRSTRRSWQTRYQVTKR